jgi:hypothetical protein
MNAENPRLLISVHGIRTFAQWQERLGRLIKATDEDFLVQHYKYGYFSVFAFLVPIFRWIALKAFLRSLIDVAKQYPTHKIHLVGHSNGTYLIGHALLAAPIALIGRIETVILAGSVLRTDFDWHRVISRLGIKQVVNDCGINDQILTLSQMGVLFTGNAGKLGFQGLTGTTLFNRFFMGGHSHYFESDGKATDEFMSKYWVPVIVDGRVDEADFRTRTGSLYGGYVWVLQNADLMKISVYLLVFYLIFSGLYLEPRRQAAWATSQKFAELISSSLGDETFPELSIKQLAQELAEKPEGPLRDHWQTLGYYFPRMENLVEKTKPRGIYRVITPYGVKTMVGTGASSTVVNLNESDSAVLLPNNMLVTVSSDGILKLFQPLMYDTPSVKTDIKRIEIREFQGAQTNRIKVDNADEFKVGAVLQVSAEKFSFLVSFSESVGSKERIRKYLLINYNLTTKEASGFGLPTTSTDVDRKSPQVDESCSWIAYLPQSVYYVLDKNIMTDQLRKYLDSNFVELLPTSLISPEAIQLKRVSLRAAREMKWKNANDDKCGASLNVRSFGISSPKSYDPTQLVFPKFTAESDMWTVSQLLPAGALESSVADMGAKDRGRLRKIYQSAVIFTDKLGEKNSFLNALEFEKFFNEKKAIELRVSNKNDRTVYIEQTEEEPAEQSSAVRITSISNDETQAKSYRGVFTTFGQKPTLSPNNTYLWYRSGWSDENAAFVIQTSELAVLNFEGISKELSVLAASFKDDESEVALLDHDWNLTRHSLPSGRLLSKYSLRTSTFIEQGGQDGPGAGSRFATIMYIGKDLLVSSGNGAFVLFDTEKARMVWSSRADKAFVLGTQFELLKTPTRDVIVVRSSNALRLLSTRTGMWLSGQLLINELLGATAYKGMECNPAKQTKDKDIEGSEDDYEFDLVQVQPNMSVTVKIGDCVFSRLAPLTKDQLVEQIQKTRLRERFSE